MKVKRDWKCDKCGYVESDRADNGDTPKCPQCAETMRKVYSAPTLLWKGKGWTERFYGGGK